MLPTTVFRVSHLSAPSLRLAIAVSLLLLLTLGCGQEASAPAVVAQPVANPTLDLAFSDIPKSFAVQVNDGRHLRLISTTEGREGEMWVDVGEKSDFGIDLVAVTNSQKAAYTEKDGGEYSGARELGTPAGKAYSVRGRYREGDALVEEARTFLLHPRENRLVTFHYRYPAAEDSAERLPELWAWIGELDTTSGVPTEELPASPP